MSKNPQHHDPDVSFFLKLAGAFAILTLTILFLSGCNTTGWPMHEIWCCDDQPHEVVE